LRSALPVSKTEIVIRAQVQEFSRGASQFQIAGETRALSVHNIHKRTRLRGDGTIPTVRNATKEVATKEGGRLVKDWCIALRSSALVDAILLVRLSSEQLTFGV